MATNLRKWAKRYACKAGVAPKKKAGSGGEGSRGGKVIGHTKSGKPIYAGGTATKGEKAKKPVAPPKAPSFEELAKQSYADWQSRMDKPPKDSSAARALRKLGFKTK